MQIFKSHQEYKLAIILSPLIALYGFAPIYLFTEIDFVEGMISYLILSFMLILFWYGNIKLFGLHLHSFWKYGISYLCILGLHASILFFSPFPSLSHNSWAYLIYIFLSTVTVNSVMLLIMNWNRLNSQKITMERELGTVKLQHSEARIRSLQQQLQPHFLFNTLSVLKSLILEKPSEAVEYTLRLSEFLRYTLQSSKKNVVLVREELHFVKDYLALQKKRFGNALQFEHTIPEGWLDAKIPIFAFQTLVENAIKHNRFTTMEPLVIAMEPDGERVRISNNKSLKPLKLSPGTGLTNLDERYRLAFNTCLETEETETEFIVYLEVNHL